MKRAAAIFLAAALVLSLGTVSAHAAPQGRGRNHTDRDRGGFVDTDGDGVCDNCGFVDADGDGVCDNGQNGGVCPRNGTGFRCGRNG